MVLRISGRVSDLDTSEALPGVIVRVMDADLIFDDQLGECRTDDEGVFEVEFGEAASRDLLADQPDVYLVVADSRGRTLANTADEVWSNLEGDLRIDVRVPHSALVEAGLAEPLETEWMGQIDPAEARAFTTWTWRPDADTGDRRTGQLHDDLSRSSSVLELLRSYIVELEGNLDNEAPPLQKLGRLFELGLTPERVEGHFYGVPVGIRSGDLRGLAAQCGNALGFLYGIAIADVCPWVGKTFSLLTPERRDALTARALDPTTAAYAGINHFNRIELRLLNQTSFYLLSWWMGQSEAPEVERKTLGHEKNGGEFVACQAPSVYQGSQRQVFQLNYRWPRLGNPPPFRWLIDELVQVAEGLYLGQLLFATRRLLSDYHWDHPHQRYGYQHFGYFVLFDYRWNAEARRLFPHLDIPVDAPGLVPPAERPVEAARNAGKAVFQLNYRWPRLRTIIPDRYCLDELVQIAQGLYLGQLMYATNLFKAYDPELDPSEYRYGHFGYFLLMDDEWHRIRLDIGFDLENV